MKKIKIKDAREHAKNKFFEVGWRLAVSRSLRL